MLNQYIVYLKLIQYYMSIVIKNKVIKKKFLGNPRVSPNSPLDCKFWEGRKYIYFADYWAPDVQQCAYSTTALNQWKYRHKSLPSVFLHPHHLTFLWVTSCGSTSMKQWALAKTEPLVVRAFPVLLLLECPSSFPMNCKRSPHKLWESKDTNVHSLDTLASVT